jgi:hypothetical protein
MLRWWRVASSVLRAMLPAALAAAGAACAAPARPAAQPALVLYAANAGDGTVARFDAATGAPTGPPLPAGSAPAWLVAGGDGSVLVQSVGATGGGGLTHVVPGEGGWDARPVRLESGARVVLLAGDGGAAAAVVYVVVDDGRSGSGAAAGPCRLAIVDLSRSAVAGAHAACAPGEQPTGLALTTDSGGGTVAFLGLWRPAAAGAPETARLVALDARDGRLRGAHALDAGAATGPLALAAGPGGRRRLYAVGAALDGTPRPLDDFGRRFAEATDWRLLEFHPGSLAPAGEYALRYGAAGLTVAPDGREAYTVGRPGSPDGTLLQRIDLTTGAVTVLGPTPGGTAAGAAVAVAHDRLYLPDTWGDRLWVLDRAGRPLGTVSTGRRPLGLAVGAAPVGASR